MSQVYAPAQRDEVETDPRRSMTPARKHRIWKAWDERCWFCRTPVPESGPGVIYDHVGTLWIKGSDEDGDIGPIHADPCNKVKTAADQTRIAKTKRMRKLRLDAPRDEPRRSLKSRPFPIDNRPKGQKFGRSRPFPGGRA